MVKSLIKVAIGITALYVAKKVVYKKIVYPVQDVFNEQLANINRIADSFIFDPSFMNEMNEELIANSNNMFDQAVITTNQMIENDCRNMEEIIQQQQNDAMFMQQMQQPMMF